MLQQSKQHWCVVFAVLCLLCCVCCVVFAVLFVVTYGEDVEMRSIADIRNFPTTSPVFQGEPLYRMEVLPGGSFDALRSLDMGHVHSYKYSLCRVSNDGRYLLPDNTFLIPVLNRRVQRFSELIEHWDSLKSTLSSSITLQASYISIVRGTFSEEYCAVKSHMYNGRSVMTRVQLRNVLYKVKIQPESELHPTFKSRLFEIAANIQNNNQEFAHYLAELTVREYGTHYITSVDAGAVLSQVDFVLSTAVDEYEFSKTDLTASASANFLGGVFKTDVNYSNDNTQTHNQHFLGNRTYSEVNSWGGPSIGTNINVDEWQNGIPNTLVAVDRSGDPLNYAITPTTLPEIPESTVYDVAFFISEAIARCYKVNTRHGCTEQDSPNFYLQANVNDQSCQPPSTNYTFGGIYQTCSFITAKHEDLCDSGTQPMRQINPLTGDTTCPHSYISVLLHSGQYSHTFLRQQCESHCSRWSCHNNCYSQPYTTTVMYGAYWCVVPGQTEQNSGYLFGGFYTSTDANPFLGSKSCPRFYVPLHFGEDIHICVSSDYELGSPFSVPFAGFESCIAGNPLASTNPTMDNPASWPHTCPVGFTQHLVALEENCEINFCVKSGSFNQLLTMPPLLPPYRKLKQMNPNTTDTLVIIGIDGEIWCKNANGDWVKDYGDTQNGEVWVENELNVGPMADNATMSNNTLSMNSLRSSDSDLSNGAVAGISIVVTAALCTFIAAIVVLITGYTARRKRNNYRSLGRSEKDYMLPYSCITF